MLTFLRFTLIPVKTVGTTDVSGQLNPPPDHSLMKTLLWGSADEKLGWRCRGGDVEHRIDSPLTQIRFPGAARDFSPKVTFQCRLSNGVRTPPCAIACIYTCAHVIDSVIQVRIRWIIEPLKHPACIVGWAERLSPVTATQ